LKDAMIQSTAVAEGVVGLALKARESLTIEVCVCTSYATKLYRDHLLTS